MTDRPKEAPRESWLTSKENARLLIANIKDYAIYVLDLEGHIVSWAPGAERIKGYAEDEVIGKHFSMFFTPEDIEAAEPDRELVAAVHGHIELEGWRVRKDKTRFWADVTVTPMRDATGEIRGFVKVTRDLTERRERDAQRLQLARTEEMLRLQNDFLAQAKSSIETTLVTLRVHMRSLIGTVEGIGDEEVRAKLKMLDWGLDRMMRAMDKVVASAEATTAKLNEELARSAAAARSGEE
jgi:PAS domain S-box-containing protein